MISTWFLWGKMLLGGELKKDAQIQILTFLRAPSVWDLGVCL